MAQALKFGLVPPLDWTPIKRPKSHSDVANAAGYKFLMVQLTRRKQTNKKRLIIAQSFEIVFKALEDFLSVKKPGSFLATQVSIATDEPEIL